MGLVVGTGLSLALTSLSLVMLGYIMLITTRVHFVSGHGHFPFPQCYYRQYIAVLQASLMLLLAVHTCTAGQLHDAFTRRTFQYRRPAGQLTPTSQTTC